MSIQRAADLIGMLLDVPVSTGFAGGLIARVADRLAGFETTLKDRLRNASVLHHDQTPTRVADDDDDDDDDDRLLYVYTARASKLVWFGAADNRGHGTLVRENYPGYAKYDKQLTAVQLCCAHLLPALRGIGELDTDPTGCNAAGPNQPARRSWMPKPSWPRPAPTAPPPWTPTC